MGVRSRAAKLIAEFRWRHKIGWVCELADYSFGIEFWRDEWTGKLRMVER